MEEWRILIQSDAGGGDSGGSSSSDTSTGENTSAEKRDMDTKTRSFYEQSNEQFKNLKPFIVTGGLLYMMYHSSQISSTVMKTIGQILGAIMDVILLPFMPLFVKMVEIIVPLIPTIQRLVEAFFGPIIDFAVEKLEAIKKWVEGIDWTAVEEWVSNAGETAARWIETAYNWLETTLMPFFEGDFWANISTWWDGAWEVMKEWPVIKQICTAIEDLRAWYATNEVDIKNFFSDPKAFIETWWNTSGSTKAKSIFESVMDYLMNLGPVKAIGNFVVTCLNYFINSGRLERFWDKVVEIAGSVASIVGYVAQLAGNVHDNMYNYGGDLVGIHEQINERKGWEFFIPIWGAVQGIKSFVEGVQKYPPREGKQIGGYISQTGQYTLHEGEEVIPAALVRALDNRSMSTSPSSTIIEMHNTFNIELIPSGSVDELARDVKNRIVNELSTILRRQ